MSSELRKQSQVDYEVLITRLERMILSGDHSEKGIESLRQQEVWSVLAPEQGMRWVALAQVARLDDVVIACLDHLHTSHPGFRPAWEEHREYLTLLGRGQDLVALKAWCRQVAPECAGIFDAVAESESDAATLPASIDSPFTRMKREEALIDRFLDLFQGRQDCHARQWADKKERRAGYVPVRSSLGKKEVREHFSGTRTFGIYLMRPDATVRVAVIDADLIKALRTSSLSAADKTSIRRERTYLIQRIRELSLEVSMPCLAEFSGGKGYHFWYFFAEPVSAASARRALGRIAGRVAPDLKCFNLEVFPKQDGLSGKGFGNLVKLPLGVHRGSGRKSWFLDRSQGSIWEQAAVLEEVERIASDAAGGAAALPSARVTDHPTLKKWREEFPELGELQDRCPALAQVFALCREGRELGMREEKVLYGTVGFLSRKKTLLHGLLRSQTEYNPHLVDYRLSRLRGRVLGCRKIHALLGVSLDICTFEREGDYAHPLLHLPEEADGTGAELSERAQNLQDALDGLKAAMGVVERFMR